MRKEQRNYVLVGGFVAAMVTALILWIMLMTGRTGATDDYFVVYQSVNGLKPGVEILYEGFPVGVIEGIEPIDQDGRRRFRVDIGVERGWPIPEDSHAAIATGIFSAALIDIQGGESEKMLEPGDRIPSQEAVDLVAAVNAAANRATAVLNDVSQRAPDILDNVEQFTIKMNEAVEQVNALLGPTNLKRIDQILTNVETVSGQADTVIANLSETRRKVDALIGRLDALFENERGDVAKAIDDLSHSLAAVARHIDSIAANLEATTRNLNEFSRQVRENPGVLIRGRETEKGS